jgi:hypothetical protein
MSQFYATIQGNRSARTCQGHKTTGINGHIRGWNIGVKVYGHFDEATQKDIFEIYRTGGSNGNESDKLIKTIKE